MEIVLASGNQGKIREIRKMLEGYPIELKSMYDFEGIPDEIIEDGETFYDNALIKAKTIYNVVKRPTLAEDSGLTVDALNGEPGVRSARYGCEGEEKPDPEILNQRVLDNLKDVPEGKRSAQFVAVMVLIIDDETVLVSEGKCHGEITFERKGTKGFGFDPIFYVKEFGMTTGEMEPEQKNKISHRGKALEGMKAKIAEYLKEKN